MDKSVSRCVLFVDVNFPSSIDVTFFVKQDNPRVVKSHLNNVLQQRSFMALLFLAQLGEKEERSQPKLFNVADKENCFLMTLQRKCCPHSASSSIKENKKKDLFLDSIIFILLPPRWCIRRSHSWCSRSPDSAHAY